MARGSSCANSPRPPRRRLTAGPPPTHNATRSALMFSREHFVIAPQWQAFMREHGILSTGDVYALAGGEIFKRSGSNEVRRVCLGAPGAGRVLFIKKYWIARPRQIWSGLLRGAVFGTSKARREFENLRQLREWGLDAPAPAAFGEERRWGVVMRSFLMSEAVPDAAPLHHVIQRWLPAQSPEARRQWRERLIARLAGYTRRMHERRFAHHDYFWRNIILSGHSLERFHLIDSHKGRVWRPSGVRRSRAKDLATLDAPAPGYFRRPERLRFYLLYAGRTRLTPDDKSFLRDVLRRADPMRERQARRVLES